MVEACGIEPQSKTKLLLTSTCLEKLLGFNLASHNLQGYTRRFSKVLLRRETNLRYIYMKGDTSNPAYLESTGEAARL
jgi:hypothetical protein